MLNKRKGAVNIGNGFQFMIGAFVLLILAFTWFFPTLNASNALNNSSTLWIGGTDYSWVVPLISVLLGIAIVIIIIKGSGVLNMGKK